MGRVSLEACENAGMRVASYLSEWISKNPTSMIYCVPKGGVKAFEEFVGPRMRPGYQLTNKIDEADIVFDDLYDSGATLNRLVSFGQRSVVMFSKAPGTDPKARVTFIGALLPDNEWAEFPWEEGRGFEDIFIRLLQFVGEDPTRGGLIETPDRAAKAWQSWTSGYQQDPEDVLKVFTDGAESYDQMVCVKGIPVYSHCEHHLAPIFGVAHVAYIPNGKIVGLSKLNRLVDVFARRLQVQERLTSQIANTLQEFLQPLGAAVCLECRHLCMESRGIRQQGHTTITTALTGEFKENPAVKQEFFDTLKVR